MKLNLGSNTHSIAGYINIDIEPLTGVDLVADAVRLPFKSGVVDEIYAGHLLEHLSRPTDFFLECHRILVSQGQLAVVVPDICHNNPDANIIIGVLFGFWLDDDRVPDPHTKSGMHQTCWSADTLVSMAEYCGFEYSRVIDPQNDPRLVIGADWHTGVEFTKKELSPSVVYANTLHKQIMENRYA